MGKDLRTLWVAEDSSFSEIDSSSSISSDNIAIESNPGKIVRDDFLSLNFDSYVYKQAFILG